MKRLVVLFLSGALFMGSCSKKSEVECVCHSDTVTKSYDLGIQRNPSLPANAAKCDTLGFHDNLDTCNLIIMGSKS